ncbi:MAG: chromosomal replication initiator protein DnaA [bacterium]
MKANDLFKQFLSEISNEISPSLYNLWFSDVHLISLENNVVRIKVPMLMHKKMINHLFQDLIDSTIFNITGEKHEFEFLTEEDIEDSNDVADTLNKSDVKENVDNINSWNTHLDNDLNFDNFVVGETNRLAFIASRSVAQAPGTIHNPLFLYGRSGLGKTHLIHSIGNYITENSDKVVLYTTSSEFRNDYSEISNKGNNSLNYANEFKNKYRNVDVLIIDDIQFLVGAEKTQQEFFHTFNSLHQLNKQIIITSDKSPDDLQKIEDRLTSRFKWGLPVNINPPDFNLRCDIIREIFKKTSIDKKINEDVIEYIANSCLNDVRHITGTINRLMVYTAMMVPKTIDLDFAIEALKDYVNNNVYSTNSIDNIQTVVAEHFKVSVEDMKSKKRNSKIIRPRHVAMYLCRTETDENLAKIGLEFGGRDHSTVISACEKVKKDLLKEPDFEKMLKYIKEKL